MGTKIKCIDDSGTAKGRLTIGKEYKIIEISTGTPHYKIREDKGMETWWGKSRFKYS